MTHQYRIFIRLGDSSLEIESTDLEWVKEKEEYYFSKLTKDHVHCKPESGGTIPHAHVFPQNLSINEFYRKFVKSKGITSRTDIAVFFVYYLEKIAKKDSIKTGDVSQCFGEIAYPAYNKLNFTDILAKARRNAFLNNVNNIWSLTITGEDYIINTINAETKEPR